MKTTLVLVIAAVAGMSYAGPSDAAAFAIRASREAAARDEAASSRIALVRGTESQQAARQVVQAPQPLHRGHHSAE